MGIKSNRRKFIKKSILSAASVAAFSSCSYSKEDDKFKNVNINFNKKYKWKMVTTWSPNMPVLGEGCNLLSDWIEKMSGGRMEIKVYGGGELIPSLESFDAVSNGAIEMGSGAAYYWAGKIPSGQFFSSVPFCSSSYFFSSSSSSPSVTFSRSASYHGFVFVFAWHDAHVHRSWCGCRVVRKVDVEEKDPWHARCGNRIPNAR